MLNRTTCVKTCLMLLVSCLLPVAPVVAADWDWTLTPYIWGAGVSLDVDADDEPVLGADVSFADLLKNTEMAGMIHFEGRRGAWGFLFDTLYLDVGEETTRESGQQVPAGTEVTADLTTLIVDGAATWRPLGPDRAFEVIFGLRVLDLDTTVDLDFPTPPGGSTALDTSRTFVDGMVGARWSVPFARRWDFACRGDIGTGDTDLTWSAAATFGIRLGESDRYGIRFGYRHMDFQLEDDDEGFDIETDLTLSGGIVGFTFHW